MQLCFKVWIDLSSNQVVTWFVNSALINTNVFEEFVAPATRKTLQNTYTIFKV
jgi:hypothetical protein